MEVRPRRKKDLEWLQTRVAKERDARQRDRYRIVLLALGGLTAVQIADKVGCSRRTVQQWVYRYRDEGLEGPHERPRPRHRKNDAAVMAAWLSDASLLSRTSGERTSIRMSRSGSRTKRGSDSKAR